MTASNASELLERGRRQVMLGVGLVMGAVVLAGLTAVVLAVLGQRTAGIAVGVVGAVFILAGLVVQGQGVAKLKAGKALNDAKPGTQPGTQPETRA